jgi:protein ImuB
VDRLACVDVPALPLQLLVARHAEWAAPGLPVAVVEEDRPQSALLWVNAAARRRRVVPGMRYAASLALAPDLRAGTVPARVIEAGVTTLVERLRQFTPHVEPARREPGVFWLDAGGLERLHPSLNRWARQVHEDLRRAGFNAVAVVVGFTRFGTYAVARSLAGPLPGGAAGVCVFGDAVREAEAARAVALDRLDLPPVAREALDQLGVRTVAGLLELPAEGLLARFGPQVHDLHQLAAGRRWAPLAPRPVEEPVEAHADIDFPENRSTALLFLVARLLPPLLAELAARDQALEALTIHRTLDGTREEREDEIRLAAPTQDEAQILDLVRLRLEAEALPAGVVAITLTARGARVAWEQPSLFASRPRRDPRAADRALARLRAEFGCDAVVRARLRDGHLPEAQFAWEPLAKLAAPGPPAPLSLPALPRSLVRRIHPRPVELAPTSRREPDGWLLRGIAPGPVVRLVGPYVIRGGWWNGREIHREYHFAELARGHLVWVFYDHRRRRWFFQGQVE